MHAHQRPYRPEDFLRVRDMLVDTFSSYLKLSNGRIERRNYCRCSVAPYFGDPDPAASAACVRYWEDATRIRRMLAFRWRKDRVGASNSHVPSCRRHPFRWTGLDGMAVGPLFWYDGRTDRPCEPLKHIRSDP
jgi:hypothetical protein